MKANADQHRSEARKLKIPEETRPKEEPMTVSQKVSKMADLLKLSDTSRKRDSKSLQTFVRCAYERHIDDIKDRVEFITEVARTVLTRLSENPQPAELLQPVVAVEA